MCCDVCRVCCVREYLSTRNFPLFIGFTVLDLNISLHAHGVKEFQLKEKNITTVLLEEWVISAALKKWKVFLFVCQESSLEWMIICPEKLESLKSYKKLFSWLLLCFSAIEG